MNIKANIFGPFVGSISWEMYSFAPYAINMKKEDPSTQLIVYTRPDRFDLYGTYADVLIPLRIKNDNVKFHHKFMLKGLDISNYEKMAHMVNRKYKPYRDIQNHIYPNIKDDNHSIRWQFPRELMDYNFSPRKSNKNMIDKLLNGSKMIFIDLSNFYMEEAFYFLTKLDLTLTKDVMFLCYNPHDVDCSVLFSSRKIVDLSKFDHGESTSTIGCSIEAIKQSIMTVSMNLSEISHLSLLLKKQLFLCRPYDQEFVKTINPYKTSIQLVDDLYANKFKEKPEESFKL